MAKGDRLGILWAKLIFNGLGERSLLGNQTITELSPYKCTKKGVKSYQLRDPE